MAPCPLEAGLKLAVIFRFLVTGDSTRSLGFDFTVGWPIVAKMINEAWQIMREECQEE